ncbi:hypothetical protein LXL04_017131 [Taraxacum kok-saghyz]
MLSLAASDTRIKYTMIPPTHHLFQPSSPMCIKKLATVFIESHKPQVERAVMELLADNSTHLVGFVLDMLCSSMIDVANKFKVPSYIFFTSNAAFLGFLLHLPTRDSHGGQIFNLTDPDSDFPSFCNPVPVDSLPDAAFDKIGGGYETFHYLDHELARQSTVKICHLLVFGSMWSFNRTQIEQIAMALESIDHRFLWSIRQPPSEHAAPRDYTSYENVLPYGFLSRVRDRGMVCGWALLTLEDNYPSTQPGNLARQ